MKLWKKIVVFLAVALVGVFVLDQAGVDRITPNRTQQTVTQQQSFKPVTTASISVTSVIVKKVNGKHRYFFHLRNNAPQPFTGDVTITLLDAKHEHSNVSETYEIENPMQSGLGASVYFEVHTGPAAVHGEYGNTRFKYEVKSGGKVVDKGAGRITDNYEDLTR